MRLSSTPFTSGVSALWLDGKNRLHHPTILTSRNRRYQKILQLRPFISYDWLFLWDYTFYTWGDLSVHITGITRATTGAVSLFPLDKTNTKPSPCGSNSWTVDSPNRLGMVNL